MIVESSSGVVNARLGLPSRKYKLINIAIHGNGAESVAVTCHNEVGFTMNCLQSDKEFCFPLS